MSPSAYHLKELRQETVFGDRDNACCAQPVLHHGDRKSAFLRDVLSSDKDRVAIGTFKEPFFYARLRKFAKKGYAMMVAAQFIQVMINFYDINIQTA